MRHISRRHSRVGNWLGSALVGVILIMDMTAARGGVTSTSPLFPAGPGAFYMEVDPFHPMFYHGLDPFQLKRTRITWEGITTFLPPGYTKLDFPDVDVEGDAAVDFGADSFFDIFFDLSLTGSMSIHLSGYFPGNLGTFATEMVALNLMGMIPLSVPVIGGTPVLIRESPTLASTGQTTIQDLGGGLYRIDGFFDIFTELSLDGGATWIPSSDSTRLAIVPELSSIQIPGSPSVQ